MGNKLTTLGYFKKRLRDSGYIVDDVFRGYAQIDPRAWTVIIDPGCASLFCTCYQNAAREGLKLSDLGDFYFELYDGGQFIPGRLVVKTSSIETLIEWLVQYNINNKAPQYSARKDVSAESTKATSGPD